MKTDFGTQLSRDEMKQIKGGKLAPGSGHNISCDGKTEFADCGSSGSCQCTTVSGGGTGYYCRSDA